MEAEREGWQQPGEGGYDTGSRHLLRAEGQPGSGLWAAQWGQTVDSADVQSRPMLWKDSPKYLEGEPGTRKISFLSHMTGALALIPFALGRLEKSFNIWPTQNTQ